MRPPPPLRISQCQRLFTPTCVTSEVVGLVRCTWMCAVLFASANAHAGPLDVFGLTSRRAGQANAGLAAADDASALYYDPAGLVAVPVASGSCSARSARTRTYRAMPIARGWPMQVGSSSRCARRFLPRIIVLPSASHFTCPPTSRATSRPHPTSRSIRCTAIRCRGWSCCPALRSSSAKESPSALRSTSSAG